MDQLPTTGNTIDDYTFQACQVKGFTEALLIRSRLSTSVVFVSLNDAALVSDYFGWTLNKRKKENQ